MNHIDTPAAVGSNDSVRPGAEARRLAAAISPLRRPCAPDHLTVGAAAHMLEAQADEIERLTALLLRVAVVDRTYGPVDLPDDLAEAVNEAAGGWDIVSAEAAKSEA